MNSFLAGYIDMHCEIFFYISRETVLERSRNKYFHVSPIKSLLQVSVMKTIMLSDYCFFSRDLL